MAQSEATSTVRVERYRRVRRRRQQNWFQRMQEFFSFLQTPAGRVMRIILLVVCLTIVFSMLAAFWIARAG